MAGLVMRATWWEKAVLFGVGILVVLNVIALWGWK